jgi:transposase
MKRHELSDLPWELLAPFFPPRPRNRGGQWKDDRTAPNGISWRLNTGAPWRDVPDRHGERRTVCHRFNALRKAGTLDRILGALRRQLGERGRIDWDLWCVDGGSIRGSRAAAGASKKK